MLTNDQMIPNRFARWARARKMVAFIASNLEAGRTVYIQTSTKITKCDKRHASMFKATRSGAFMQRGKNWDCIDYCKITAA